MKINELLNTAYEETPVKIERVTIFDDDTPHEYKTAYKGRAGNVPFMYKHKEIHHIGIEHGYLNIIFKG